MPSRPTIVWLILTNLLLSPLLLAQDSTANAVPAIPSTEVSGSVESTDWLGWTQLKFKVDGRDCLLVLPESPARGKPWIWRTEFFGHQPQADVALLKRGFHVAYMNVQNMYGAPVALDHMDRFYEHVTEAFGLLDRVALEGFSRGGLFAFNWAARHPNRITCLYLDAPVCDFKSWPAGWGKGKGSPRDWQRCKQVYDLTDDLARDYPGNPVDNLAPLAKAGVPILSVCGGADDVVPVDENSLLVEQRYRQLGGSMQVILKPGLGHHPHSLQDPIPIVEFVVRHSSLSSSRNTQSLR